jgi:hypothetical protein
MAPPISVQSWRPPNSSRWARIVRTGGASIAPSAQPSASSTRIFSSSRAASERSCHERAPTKRASRATTVMVSACLCAGSPRARARRCVRCRAPSRRAPASPRAHARAAPAACLPAPPAPRCNAAETPRKRAGSCLNQRRSSLLGASFRAHSSKCASSPVTPRGQIRGGAAGAAIRRRW